MFIYKKNLDYYQSCIMLGHFHIRPTCQINPQKKKCVTCLSKTHIITITISITNSSQGYILQAIYPSIIPSQVLRPYRVNALSIISLRQYTSNSRSALITPLNAYINVLHIYSIKYI